MGRDASKWEQRSETGNDKQAFLKNCQIRIDARRVFLSCLYACSVGRLHILGLKLGFVSGGTKEHQIFMNLLFMPRF